MTWRADVNLSRPSSTFPSQRAICGVSSVVGTAVPLLDRLGLSGQPLALGAVTAGLSAAYVVSGELGGIAVDKDSEMYGASLTKQLVGALAGLAVISGQLDPDAGVRDLLPELPSWADPVRIRHLVHHLSGLPSKKHVADAIGLGHENELTNDDIMSGLASIAAPVRPPGVAYEYSNLGYICLAETVSRATGAALAELAVRWIFGPLGMTSSRLGGPAPIQLTNQPAPPRTIGDGGWWTSARDLLRWQQALNEQALGTGLMQLLEAPGALDDGTPVPYCWGVALSWRKGVRTLGHGGNVPGWTSKTVRQPEHGTAVALLTGCSDVDSISEAALRLADELR